MTPLLASRPGQPDRPNEDWGYAGRNLLVVVDGATSRTETGCIHGPAWYAEMLGQSIVDFCRKPTFDLRTVLAKSISAVAGLHRSTCNLAHPGTPSAAVGILRAARDELQLLVLADVAILLGFADDHVEAFIDDRVAAIATDEKQRALAIPIGDPRRVGALQEMKHVQLAARNRSGGYFVAGSDPDVVEEASVKSVPTTDVTAAAILSDGAHRAASSFGTKAWPDILFQIERSGPISVIDDVRDAEQSDPDAIQWPRAKVSDDATIAFTLIDRNSSRRS